MQSTVENGETIEISSKQHSMNVELGVLLLLFPVNAMDYGLQSDAPLDPSFSYPTDGKLSFAVPYSGALQQIGVYRLLWRGEKGDVEYVSNEFRIAAHIV